MLEQQRSGGAASPIRLKVKGGKGAIHVMIGANSAAEAKSVARGLIIDPGGEIIKGHTSEIEQDPRGEIIKVHTAEIEQDPGGKGAIMIGRDPVVEENSVARELMIDPGGGDNIHVYAGGGEIFYPEIKDPGGGENIDLGGSTTDNEVHRKV